MKNFLEKSKLYIIKHLRNYLPRWSILMLDTLIVIASFVFLWLFRNTISSNDHNYFFLKLTIITVIYVTNSLIFKTHHGVLRFSTMSDVGKVILCNVVSIISFTLVGAIIDYTTKTSQNPITFQFWFGLMIGTIILALQVMMRFTIRITYSYLSQTVQSAKKNAFILGSDREAVLLAQTIREEAEGQYKPIAYISDNETHVGKTVDGLPVLFSNVSTEEIKKQMKKYNAQTLLLYRKQIDMFDKEFFDNCIYADVELILVNPYKTSKWREDTSKVSNCNENSLENTCDDHSENGTSNKIEKTDRQNNEEIDYKIKKNTADSKFKKINIEDLLGRNAIEINKDELKPMLKGKSILVTGAAGSIGSEICRQLTYFNCKAITMLDQAESPLHELYIEMLPLKNNIKIKPIIASVSDHKKMQEVFENTKPNVVFHAAAYKHVPMMERQPSVAILTNVLGTKVVADLSVKFEVEKFVMISTDKAVNPTSVMGATKRAAEIYVQSLFHHLQTTQPDCKTHFVTTRFGNVLGSNGSVVPLFNKQIENGGPITLTHKDVVRYFMSIPEACSLVLEAGCTGNGGQIYVFDMGKPVKIYDLAEKMILLKGMTPGKEIQIIETGLRPGEKLYEELLANNENTIPTHHPKLRIAKVRHYDYDDVMPRIETLIAMSTDCCQPIEIVRELKKLIPEFLSKNSPEYEKLDSEACNPGSHLSELVIN